MHKRIVVNLCYISVLWKLERLQATEDVM